MSVFVDGHEFALFAAQQVEAWSDLENATLHHATLGSGTIRKVTQRPGYIPLLSVVFHSQADTVTFNSDSFKTGKISGVKLPDHLRLRFAQWKQEFRVLAETKASVSRLAEKYNVCIDQFAESAILDLKGMLALLEDEKAFRWPRPLKVHDLRELKQRVETNVNAAGLCRRFEEFGNPRDLVIACSELRRIGIPECARDITRDLNFETYDAETAAALLTTRGGALRDLSQFDEASAVPKPRFASLLTSTLPTTC